MAVDRRNPKPGQGAWLPVLLFCLVLGTFLPCLRNGFVNLDDPMYGRNPHLRQGFTWTGLKWSWSNTDSSNWHPLTWMSHTLDRQLFGLNAEGHHATSVLFHAANTALLFLLLQRITGARWRSFVVAALFGVHPLRVESVAWISERKDVLSAFFWMLTIWAYVRYVKIVNDPLSIIHSSYCLCLALFVLGLLAKPMLVTLPFVLLLLDYWPLRRWGQAPAKWLVLEKVPFLVLAAADSAVTFVAQQAGGEFTPGSTLSASMRLSNALVAYVRYLGKLVWPDNLCVMYPHPGHLPVAEVAGAGLVLVSITALVLWQWRAKPYLAVGWFWFLGTLVPVIGLVQVGRQAMADRYTYIPSIGICLAVVWGLAELSEHWRHRETIWRSVVTVVIVVCMFLTVRQIGFWKDSKTLFARAVAVNQRDWIDTAYLANELQRGGETDEAIAMYLQSVQINPNHIEVWIKLGNCLLIARHFDEALVAFQKAVALDPNDAEARCGLGVALQDLKRLDEAIDQFQQVIRNKPDYAAAYSNLGNCYGLKGRPDDAIPCFEQAAKLKPDSAQNHRELGVGLANKQRWDEAIEQFRRAVELEPSDIKAQGYLDAAMQAKAMQLATPASAPNLRK